MTDAQREALKELMEAVNSTRTYLFNLGHIHAELHDRLLTAQQKFFDIMAQEPSPDIPEPPRPARTFLGVLEWLRMRRR